MQRKSGDLLNWKAEFRDPQLERAYTQDRLLSSSFYYKYILLLFGIIFLGIALFDYGYNTDISVFLRSTSVRLFVFVFSLVVFLVVQRIKHFQVLSLVNVGFTVAVVLCYLYILASQRAQGFMEQAMALMVILLCMTMLPMRWVHFVVGDVLLATSFLVGAQFYIDDLPTFLLVEAGIYLGLTILFTSLVQYKLGSSLRSQYAKERQFEHSSVTDALTGIHNRLFFDQRLGETCAMAPEASKRFSVVLFDIDNFKSVNDTYGHLVGDRVLVACTALVSSVMRKEDIFARWGGEEFVIMLLHADEQSAAEFAERIRSQLERARLDKDAGTVTCSFGVAEHLPGEDALSIMKRVDNCLYEAKQTGKNKVVAYSKCASE